MRIVSILQRLPSSYNALALKCFSPTGPPRNKHAGVLRSDRHKANGRQQRSVGETLPLWRRRGGQETAGTHE